MIGDLGSYLAVAVQDNRSGMSPMFNEKIFDVLQTLRIGKKPESTGIGSAILKKTVQHHSYEVSASSSDPKGAEFSFIWPKAEAIEESAIKKFAQHGASDEYSLGRR